MKCRRPACTNKANRSLASGLCNKHHRNAGPSGWVDATHAREHLNQLRRKGMEWDDIAAATGITRGGLYYIRKNPQCRIATEQRIMAVKPPKTTVPSKALTPSLGTQRRIGALMALGHQQCDIAHRAGIPPTNIGRIFKSPTVGGSTAAAFAKVFEELQFTPGSSERAKAWAKKRGFPPPMGWNDIDDPDDVPHMPKDRAGWMESYWELMDLGLSKADAAKRLGVKVETVEQRLRRLAS